MAHLIFHAGSAGKATKANAGGMLRHTQRKKLKSNNHKNKDIDTTKTKYNIDIMKNEHNKNKMSAHDVLEERLKNDYKGKRKLRKDQVVLREVITQPSPEFFEGMSIDEKREHMQKFMLDAMPWFHKEFGADNVLGASAHLDETNPHAHFMIMPMTKDGRISQTEFFTGPQALQQQHKTFREHMIQKGWDFEVENKYEDIDNHTLPAFKANAKRIQAARASQTEEVRNMSQDADIRQEAVKMALQDVHANVLKEEREKLEKEREKLEERERQLKKRDNALFEQQKAQSRAHSDNLNDLHARKIDFMKSIADVTRGFVSVKSTQALETLAKNGHIPEKESVIRSVLNDAVKNAIKQGREKELQQQSREVTIQKDTEPDLEL